MTARQCFEGALSELSKTKSPSLLLEDFNYFFNKAINQYINKHYNIYDVNQQSTDDLRVLKATAILDPEPMQDNDRYSGLGLSSFSTGKATLFDATYEVYLPLDYLHILNCICVYRVKERYKCYDRDNYVQFPAKRLTADAWSIILNDFYNRPLYKRPYYYIHNVNTSVDLPTNPIQDVSVLQRTTEGTDASKDYFDSKSNTVYVSKYKEGPNGVETSVSNPQSASNEVSKFKTDHPNYIVTETITVNSTSAGQSNLPRTISLTNIGNKSQVEKEPGVRYGNSTAVRCEIRYGNDRSVFELEKVLIDYIKAPQQIRLTQEQIDLTRDTSQIMEFPDYVCQEIINELVTLIMERDADPRTQSHQVVSQSIANPAQQQAQVKQG